MAIGPSEMKARRMAEAKAIESSIDRALAGGRSDRVTIDVKQLGITRSLWDSILRPKYREAGWKWAEWVSEERDGDYLDFRA